MKMRKQSGSVLIEYIVVGAAVFIAWNFVSVVKTGFIEHQAEYTWSISQPHI